MLLRTRTGRAALAVSEMRSAKEIHRKVDKESVSFGKRHAAQARSVKTFRNGGDAKNGTAGL